MREESRERGYTTQFINKVSVILEAVYDTYPLNSGLAMAAATPSRLDMIGSLPIACSRLSSADYFEASTRAFIAIVRGAMRRPLSAELVVERRPKR